LNVSRNYDVNDVEPALLARVVTRLEKVNFIQMDLTEKVVTAIFRAVCNEPIMKLKVLDMSGKREIELRFV